MLTTFNRDRVIPTVQIAGYIQMEPQTRVLVRFDLAAQISLAE